MVKASCLSFTLRNMFLDIGRGSMAGTVVLRCCSSVNKVRTWKRCSKQIKEQRARLYIIWKCAVFLLSSHD
ncbi:DVL family [Arabidopsis thaliana x Arabidopsis arenosa]|uniref:DVL family n=1 Tax=Arabidopsis thaliana x Arabidopsis arenosa TaxID=1240361 RepID=A0A8T1XGI1_9BRAS|nr:DVL family [Arabidopsis thaliana x Arabidopsis arenosa]